MSKDEEKGKFPQISLLDILNIDDKITIDFTTNPLTAIITKSNGQTFPIKAQEIKPGIVATDISSPASVGDKLSVPISSTQTREFDIDSIIKNPSNPQNIFISGPVFVGNHNQNLSIVDSTVTLNDFQPLFQDLKASIQKNIPAEKIDALIAKVEELEKSTDKSDLKTKFIKFIGLISQSWAVLSPAIEPIIHLIGA